MKIILNYSEGKFNPGLGFFLTFCDFPKQFHTNIQKDYDAKFHNLLLLALLRVSLLITSGGT